MLREHNQMNNLLEMRILFFPKEGSNPEAFDDNL